MASQQELLDTINAPNWKVWVSKEAKHRAAMELGQMGPVAISGLIDSFDKPGAAYAVLALKEIGSPAVPALLKALSTPGAAYATLALKEIGATCVDELIQEFRGEGAAYAVLALKEIGPPAVQPLIEALRSPNETIRMWSALCLGEMGRWAQSAVPSLTACCSDPSADVREAAKDALGKIQ